MRTKIVPKIALALLAVILLNQQILAQVHIHDGMSESIVVEEPYVESQIVDSYVETGHDHAEYFPAGATCEGCAPATAANCTCSSCTSNTHGCHTCRAPFGLCFCLPSHGWVQAESLFWYPTGMYVPALISTSPDGTARAQAGVLGNPTTSILFGDEEILDGDLSGVRIRFGTQLAILNGLGIEGEYVGLDEEESFFRESSGSPILARPFLNALVGGEDAQLLAFPDEVTGDISVETNSSFQGAAFRFRQTLCCGETCKPGWLDCRTLVPTSTQVDLTLGYRFWELGESLYMRQRTQEGAGTTAPSELFDIRDNFDTRNLFNGLEIGIDYRVRRRRWTLDALLRCGVGNVNQTVDIRGSTEIQSGVTVNEFDNGFLAQRSNIGRRSRDVFSIVPEVGLTLGRQFTQRLRFTLGYSAVYLGNVVRPGDQVNTLLNPNLFAPEANPFAGPLQPDFRFNESGYFVHGWNVGAVYRW